ncbi:acyl-CoA dehydrogenase family protein [Mariniplasma anaerobium]|uniref:Butyryl-CoA dehydrogenase n=1 Tax=Mariniplasma anaerobium TaxID=2735436 RepID=A0A7U9TIK6_9MOLU|nr:acyl-CoA dehydrogenase family protein [Mariniplasma anaerobium]BCR36022.1 butyryl-CoA dehydrogenase [Mariniplasma anaerobium]
MRIDLLNEMVEEFSKTYVKPLARSVDEEERFPAETVELLGKYGLLGLPFPKEYGGVGADTKAYIDTVRTISKDCATTSVIISAHTSLCSSPIFMFGSEAQKAKYLTKLNKGEYLGAFGLTEPGAGTDASQQQTKAVDFGDYYELTGSKIFITNAGYADVYIIFAMTQPELGLKGISAFIVEKDIKGFTVGPKEKKMGIRGSSTCELIFQKARVPKENLLGKEGQGFKIAMQTLDGGRIGIAAQALGIAEGAFERAVSYVKTRTQFNRPISKFQNTQFVIADLKTQIEAARGLLYQAVADKDENRNYTVSAAMAKLYCSKVAVEVSDKAIQLMGGYGYIRDYEVERYLRDAKITEIYEGTSEVQRMVIAGKVLA